MIDSKILIYTITGKAPKSEIKEIMYWLTFKKKMTTFEVKKMISVITKNADYSPDKLVAKTMIEIEGWKARYIFEILASGHIRNNEVYDFLFTLYDYGLSLEQIRRLMWIARRNKENKAGLQAEQERFYKDIEGMDD